MQCPGELQTRTSPAMRPVVGAWAAATPMEPTALAATQPVTRPMEATRRCMRRTVSPVAPPRQRCRGGDRLDAHAWPCDGASVRCDGALGQLCDGALHV